jgi:acyl phosphate:glycerol-3-phosphate acyltransferase
MPYLLTAALAYLAGSIPFGYLLVRIFHGTDIRQTGSGNIGATNVSRTSPKLGMITLLLDAAKGLAPVLIARALHPDHAILFGALAGFCAVLGHIFPIWLRFRGGKGVATGLGAFICVAPKSLLVMVGIFFAVVAAFRYISLGSIIATLALPLLAWQLDHLAGTPWLLTSAAALLIVVKHRKNIRRLLSGTESRFTLRRG